MWQHFCKHPIVKFLASLKLAVCVIAGYIVFMAWGTIAESQYNTVYAKYRVYLSPVFISLQIFLFLNILFAALVRLPYQKKLTGFYITHLGLLTLFIGAAITAALGIDGNLRLMPNQPTKNVIINEPTLYTFFQGTISAQPIEISTPLPQIVSEFKKPKKVFTEVLDYDIYLNHYIPFAVPQVRYITQSDANKKSRDIAVTLSNANFGQQIVELSTEQNERRQIKLGPLTMAVFSDLNSSCYQKALPIPEARYALTSRDGECLILNQIGDSPVALGPVIVKKIQDKPTLKLEVTDKQRTQIFYPEISSLPVNDNIELDATSPWRLFILPEQSQNPEVLFFADDMLGFGKGKDWQFARYENGAEVTLPWMGFKLTVDRVIKDKTQHTDWLYKAPKGNDVRHWAAEVRVQNRYDAAETHTLWIDDTETKQLSVKNGTLELMLGNKMVQLPFEVTLDQFKMATNPGTNEPASYESFVNVKETDSTMSQAHIFMNNPLKRDKFTLYQASYFEIDNQGTFGSVLSVNHDPGRVLKYLGSFLIVAGTIIHFTIRHRKAKTV